MSRTVLVIDDDALVCMLVEHKLSARGYRVITAQDGAAGLERARQDVPDLIILDMMMPILDGRQVLQQIHADETLRSVPVIMLTARRGEGDVVDALGLGAADYINKPFSPEELAARVMRLLPQVRGTGT
jgi:DNA-binding response OmpR family regulator